LDDGQVFRSVQGQVGSFRVNTGAAARGVLVASVLPRGTGSQKEVGMLVASVNSTCLAISLPWSQVMLRINSAGRVAMAFRMASSTATAP